MICAGWLACALSLGTASAQSLPDVQGKVRAAGEMVQKHLDLLRSPKEATRVAALTEMLASGNTALSDLAIETALASEDRALQAIALRAGFRQVRSLVAKLSDAADPAGRAVVQACGDAVQYVIESYDARTGAFEVRGQDHSGVGQVSGTSVSLTIEYGCSLAAKLRADGTLIGIVSAPYKKGSLPAEVTFR